MDKNDIKDNSKTKSKSEELENKGRRLLLKMAIAGAYVVPTIFTLKAMESEGVASYGGEQVY